MVADAFTFLGGVVTSTFDAVASLLLIVLLVAAIVLFVIINMVPDE
jgi:hypothetical protein